MSEIGALSLRIQETGGRAVVDRLREIDASGGDTNAAMQNLSASMKAVSASATTVTTAARAVRDRLQGIGTGGGAASAALRDVSAAMQGVGASAPSVARTKDEIAKLAFEEWELNKKVAETTRLFKLQANTADLGSKKAVRELRLAAVAQREWMQSIGASAEQQLRFTNAVQIFERKVERAAAKARTPVAIPVRVDGIAQAQAAVANISTRIGQLVKGLNFDATRASSAQRLAAYEAYLSKQVASGNVPLQARIALEQQLVTVRAALAPATQKAAAAQSALAASLTKVGATIETMGAGLVFGAGLTAIAGVGAALKDSARAFDDAEAAARKLNASSRLTGAALSDVQRIAKQGQTAFRLSASASADLTANVVKLTMGANRLNQSGEFMSSWLDLAAANGLTAAEAMQALQTTIIGQDEGLNKLGLSNPQQIYERWAKEAGTTAAKMSDVEKKQAIINEIIAKGSTVVGEYAKRLDTAAGKSELLRQKTEALKVELGRMFLGAREGVNDGGSSLLGWLTTAIAKFNDADEAGERFWRNVARRLRGQPLEFAPTTPTAADRLRQQGPPNPFARTPITVTTTPFDAKKAAADAARAESERQSKLDAQIAALTTLADLRKVDLRALQVAAELETALTAELGKQGQSLEDQAETLERLNALRRTGLLIAEAKPRSAPRSSDPASQAAKSIAVSNKRDRDLLGLDKQKPEGLDDFEQSIADGIGNALASGIAGGFAQGLAEGGIGEGFKQMAAQMLAGLGDVFLQVGAKAILGSQLLASLAKGLAGLNPAIAIAAGVALIALASTMQAKGGRGGGGGSRSFGGFSSGSGLNNTTTLLDPATRFAAAGRTLSGQMAASPAPVGPTLEVIGLQSARAQRLLGTSNKTYKTRGG